MPQDPNHDPAALKASESKTQETGENFGKKHRKLIIFLIVILFVIAPLTGIIFTLLYW